MALTGGKVNWNRPLDTLSGIISIGDWRTTTDEALSIVVGAGAVISGAAEVGTIVYGAEARSTGNTGNIVFGHAAFADVNSDNSILMGAASHLGGAGNSSTETIAIGFLTMSSATGNNAKSVALGAGSTMSNSPGTVVIGNSASATESARSVVIGYSALVDYTQPVIPDEARLIAIGSGATCHASVSAGRFAIAIGHNATTHVAATSGIAVGYATVVYSPDTVALGESVVCRLGSDASVAIGTNLTIEIDCPGNVLLGHDMTIVTAGGGISNAVMMGYQASLAGGSSGSVVIGSQASTLGLSVGAVVIGHGATSTTFGSGSVVIGNEAQATSPSCVTIGYRASAGSGSIAIGSATSAVSNPTVSPGGGVIIGNGSYFTTVNPTPADVRPVILGVASAIDESDRSLIVGTDNSISAGNEAAVILGRDNHITSSNEPVHIIGAGNLVGLNCPSATILGNVNTLQDSPEVVVLGNANELLSGQSCVVFGNRNTLPAEAASYSVIIGDDISHGANFSISMGFNIVNNTDNTMVVGDNADAADAIHRMVVWGYNGGSFITVAFDDNPDDGKTGMTVAYNNGATVVNRDVYISAAPPVGSVLLYMVP